MKLHELKAPESNQKVRKRIGRGEGSGRGGQSGRGHNGQKSRGGNKLKPWFEGGQMPLQRRIPKFGFKNRFRTEYQPLNLDKLSQFIESGRLGEKITLDDLIQNELIGKKDRVKLLGGGEMDKKIEIDVHACSNSARKKVEAAGGTINEIA
ncbi:MAG: 50S ribosomal protein L15 [Balneolaceae bacterium]